MKIGVIHYNFPGYSLEQFLDFVQETDYGYVELQIGDVWDEKVAAAEPEKAAERVRSLLDDREVRVSAVAAGNDFVVLDEEAVAFQVKRMERIGRLARILGAKVVRTEGGRPKEEVPSDRWVEAMAGCIKRCLDFGEREDLYFAVDNHGLVTNDGDLQVKLFETVGSKRVGANLDTMNYRWFGHDLETIGRYYEIVAPYVLHTHLKDGVGSRSTYRGTVLGEGEIDLEKAIRCLQDVGYDGVWCVEYEGKEGAEGYRKCLPFLKAHL